MANPKSKIQLMPFNPNQIEQQLSDIDWTFIDTLGAVNDASPPVIGDATVTVDGFKANVPVGSVVGFAGDPRAYYVEAFNFSWAGNFDTLAQGNRNWFGLCAAPNGDIYCAVAGGDIYKQTGGSGSFAAMGQTSRIWYGLAADSLGNIYAIASSNVYKLIDGTFVQTHTLAGTLSGICVDAYNNIYVADGATGDIYKKLSTAESFTALNQTPRAWYGMAAAPNGNIYATVVGGDIYMQTGGSGNFVGLGGTSRQWEGICAALNGDVFAVVYNGSIYRQTAGAGAFNDLVQTARQWRGITASPNGDLYACVQGADIYERLVTSTIDIAPALKTNLANDQVVRILPHFNISDYITNRPRLKKTAEFEQNELMIDKYQTFELFNKNSIAYNRKVHTTGFALTQAWFTTYNSQNSPTDNMFVRWSWNRNQTGWKTKYSGKVVKWSLDIDAGEKTVEFKTENVFNALKDITLAEIEGVYECHRYCSPTRKVKYVSGQNIEILRKICNDPNGLALNSKSYTITNKVKTNHVCTLQTSVAHSIKKGELITVAIGDTNFDVRNVIVTDIPAADKFSYIKKIYTSASCQVAHGGGYGAAATEVVVDTLSGGFTAPPSRTVRCRFNGHATIYDATFQFETPFYLLSIPAGLTNSVADNETIEIGHALDVASTNGTWASGTTQYRIRFDTPTDYFNHTHQRWEYDMHDGWWKTMKWRKEKVEESSCFDITKALCEMHNSIICTDFLDGIPYAFFRSKINTSPVVKTLTADSFKGRFKINPDWQFHSSDGVRVNSDIEYWDGQTMQTEFHHKDLGTDTQRYTSDVKAIVAITSSGKVSGTCTLNCASHTYVTGDHIYVNLGSTHYDGRQVITSVTATTIVYTFGTNSAGSASGIVSPDISVIGDNYFVAPASVVQCAVNDFVKFRDDDSRYKITSISGDVHYIDPVLKKSIKPMTPFSLYRVPELNIQFAQEFRLKLKQPDFFTSHADTDTVRKFYNNGAGLRANVFTDYANEVICNFAGGITLGLALAEFVPMQGLFVNYPCGDSLIMVQLDKIFQITTRAGIPNYTPSLFIETTGGTDWFWYASCGYIKAMDDTDIESGLHMVLFFTRAGNSGSEPVIHRIIMKMENGQDSSSVKINQEYFGLYRLNKLHSDVRWTNVDVTGAEKTFLGIFVNSSELNPDADDFVYFAGKEIAGTFGDIMWQYAVGDNGNPPGLKTFGGTRLAGNITTIAVSAGAAGNTDQDLWHFHTNSNGRIRVIPNGGDHDDSVVKVGGGATVPAVGASCNATDFNFTGVGNVQLAKGYENVVIFSAYALGGVYIYDEDAEKVWCVYDDNADEPLAVVSQDFVAWWEYSGTGSDKKHIDICGNASLLQDAFYNKERRELQNECTDKMIDYADYTLFDRFGIVSSEISTSGGDSKWYVVDYEIDIMTHDHKFQFLESVEG